MTRPLPGESEYQRRREELRHTIKCELLRGRFRPAARAVEALRLLNRHRREDRKLLRAMRRAFAESVVGPAEQRGLFE